MNQQEQKIPAYSGYDKSKFTVIDELTCSDCSGEGWIYSPVFEEEEKCWECNGTGALWVLEPISEKAIEAIQAVMNAAQKRLENMS